MNPTQEDTIPPEKTDQEEREKRRAYMARWRDKQRATNEDFHKKQRVAKVKRQNPVEYSRLGLDTSDVLQINKHLKRLSVAGKRVLLAQLQEELTPCVDI